MKYPCCAECRVELNDRDKIIRDDFAMVYHERCYDFEKRAHLVDSVGTLKDMDGSLPRFLLDTYKKMFAMDEDETRSPDEIPDEEVIDSLAYTLGYVD